jgi:cob(I)alamin adenosyltransferase
MFTKTTMALAAIMLFGVASSALAGDEDTTSLAQIERDAAESRAVNRMGNVGTANAYFALPSEQESQSRKKGHSR